MIFVRNLILTLFLIGCTTPSGIDQKDVKRILETLSSDEMQGRRTFTPGIEKAAAFIASEFEEIGLKPIDNLSSFYQRFTATSVAIKESKVVINNKLIEKNNYFIRLSDGDISWTDTESVEVSFINTNDDFGKKASEAFARNGNLLVMVSTEHKDIFNRYRSYMERPRIVLPTDSESSANLVFVLMDTNAIDQLYVEASSAAEEKQLANIVGKIEGNKKDEIVVFSAHYDHLGIGKPVEGDSIFNGANDDASGTTAVIELANYYKQKGTPERTLIFATFTAEEIGGFGSRYFSKQLDPDKIVAMINIEMIGKPSKEGINSAWLTGWNKSDLGEIMEHNLDGTEYTLYADPYPEQNLFYRSDNATLARLGVPAHSISTTQIDIDTDYHQVSDELATLDVENITQTINAIAIGAQGIVDGRQTPTRINPDEVKR
ncbi:MAG: M20/M25/M40 family metallo-hydrolase [Cyclobacteriaceae bacterium]|nr:M20/M25/M40 family metallo-hydrolase [Cyclobacteriaceae bacterium]